MKSPVVGGMFTKSGIIELHGITHDSLEVVLRHVATVPDNRLREPVAGFGFPTVWKQLVHILTVEEGWVHDLQYKPFDGWREEDVPTIAALFDEKHRIRDATRAYVERLDESQLNVTLAKRPEGWFGQLRSPAFILLHVITHTFHHKGQVVAMLRALGHPAPDTDLQRQ
jgi:uncharacterized damage-inducible protein DinB